MGISPDLVGSVAAVLTTGAYLPQAIRVIRHRETAAISLVMYIFMTLGVTLWMIYGIMIQSPPVVIANAITAVLTLIILAMKIRCG